MGRAGSGLNYFQAIGLTVAVVMTRAKALLALLVNQFLSSFFFLIRCNGPPKKHASYFSHRHLINLFVIALLIRNFVGIEKNIIIRF